MITKASKFLATKRITTKMMYKEFVKANPQTNIDYNLFKKIVIDSNKTIVDECIKGGVYNFDNSVGTLSVTKYEKAFYLDEEGKVKGLKVDFGATRKNKKAGNSEVIYHTNTLVCKWTFGKNAAFATKKRWMWQFAPTDGPKGISRKLHKYIEENPRCTINYETKQAPFKQDK